VRAIYAAAELQIAQWQRLLSVPEDHAAVVSILGPWEERNFEECARIIARFPILHGDPCTAAFLADAMISFTADLIVRLVDLNLFVAVPTAAVPRCNVWTYAVELKRLDVLCALWTERGKHPINASELTKALSYAAGEAGGSKLVPWLIEVGADLSAVAAEPRYQHVDPLTLALYDALKGGTEHTVRALLALGAHPNRPNAAGGVPLVWAACYGDAPKVRALLAHGAHAPEETEDAEFWSALADAPEECVKEIRRSCRSRDLVERLDGAMGQQPVPSSARFGEVGPL
jgi:hypothetical protein